MPNPPLLSPPPPPPPSASKAARHCAHPVAARYLLPLALTVAPWFSVHPLARADDAATSLHSEGTFRLKLGGGGAVQAKMSIPSLQQADISGDDALVPSVGFGLGADLRVHPMVSVGAATDFNWWNSRDLDGALAGRSFLWDLNGVVTFRYPLFEGAFATLRLPVGLTVSSTDEVVDQITQVELSNAMGLDLRYRDGVGYGWNLSLMGGVSYALSPSWSGAVEIGWTRWDVTSTSSTSAGDSRTSLTIDQLSLNVGFAFTLTGEDPSTARAIGADDDASERSLPRAPSRISKQQAPAAADTSTASQAKRTLTITATECNLRAAPDRKSAALKKLRQGQQCEALTQSERWHQASCQGMVGYIHDVCLGAQRP